MDLKVFYQKIRRVRETIASAVVVTVSLETPDGGREGVFTEVSREAAARLLVEGRVRLATESEAEEFHAKRQEALREAEERESKQRVQVAVLSDEDIQLLRSQTRRLKG